MSLHKARASFLSLLMFTSGCATTPPIAEAPPQHSVLAAPTVEALAASDLSWLSWGVLACCAGALAAYLLRSYLPFNGVTSKVLIATALTFAIIRYVLVIVTPFLYTTLVIAGLCTATYFALTRGPSLYAQLRDALRQWYARSRE